MKDDPTEIFKKTLDLSYEENISATSPEEFEKIIQNRRSVRVFNDEKIPPTVVQRVLDWALLAPNSSNLQPWEFYWVQNSEKKSKIVEACFSQPAAKTAQEIIVCVARLDKWREIRKEMLDHLSKQNEAPSSVIAYYKRLVPIAYSVGPLNLFGLSKKILTTIVGAFRPVPREPTTRADLRVWAVKSTALACQNIMMGFSSYGIDTCPMEGMDSKRIKKILKLNHQCEIVMVIGAGKRDKKGVYGPRIRMAREKFIKKVS